jgi:hypothetical protein
MVLRSTTPGIELKGDPTSEGCSEARRFVQQVSAKVKGGKMGSEYEAGLVEPSAAAILAHALAALNPPPRPARPSAIAP